MAPGQQVGPFLDRIFKYIHLNCWMLLSAIPVVKFPLVSEWIMNNSPSVIHIFFTLRLPLTSPVIPVSSLCSLLHPAVPKVPALWLPAQIFNLLSSSLQGDMKQNITLEYSPCLLCNLSENLQYPSLQTGAGPWSFVLTNFNNILEENSAAGWH